MKKAVIDIGTNSIKFTLAEGGAAGTFAVLRDVSEIVRFGEGLRETGAISKEALERNAKAVVSFVEQAREAGAEEIKIAGTMALRSARNAGEFVKSIKDMTGLDVEILSGDDEARLSFDAVLSGIPGAAEASLVSFDTGGGSTEFVFGEAGVIKREFSINIGAIRVTEEFFTRSPVASERLETARARIRRELSAGGVDFKTRFLVGMGGNVTSLASVSQRMKTYDAALIQGSKLRRADIQAQIKEYASKTVEERMKIIGLEPGRARIILAGACIIEAVMELCGADELAVSDKGVRHGLLYRLFKEDIS